MVRKAKSLDALAFRLLPVVLLLGCPRIGSAAGTWSVISLAQQPGEVISPWAVAVDSVGNLYVADMAGWGKGRIQKRDAQGNWSILATAGDAPGQVDYPRALTMDAADNLYVGDIAQGYTRIQKRDTQGNCYENRELLPSEATGHFHPGWCPAGA